MKLSFLLPCFLALFPLTLAPAQEKEPSNTFAAPQNQQYGSVEERRIMESLQIFWFLASYIAEKCI